MELYNITVLYSNFLKKYLIINHFTGHIVCIVVSVVLIKNYKEYVDI